MKKPIEDKKEKIRFEKLGPMKLPSRIASKDNPIMFKLYLYIARKTGHRYYILEKGEINDGALVRIDSKCVYAHIFGSARCDCAEQLHSAIKKISREGGLLIYAYDQDGRGINLREHLRVYQLQDQGLDTVEANLKIGLQADQRNYEEIISILKEYKLKKIKLLTNNPQRIQELSNGGIEVERVPFSVAKIDRWNAAQLIVKQTRLKHLFNWDLTNENIKKLFYLSLNQIKW